MGRYISYMGTIILSTMLATPALAQILLQKAKPVDGHALGFLIMGTIAQKTPDNNVALIKVTSSGQVVAVKIGTVIDNKYKVTDVSEKYIRVITRDAKNFLVYLDKFAGEFRAALSAQHGPAVNPDGTYKEDGFERADGKVIMTSAYRDRIANHDLSKILMQATAEPVVQSGVIVGFRLYQIDQDSIFSKGGMKDDDIIIALNGLKLNSVAGAISTLKSLKEATTIEVDILRGGETKSISIGVK